MIELTDYLDAEGFKAMSFDERDRKIEDLLGTERFKLFEQLLGKVGECPTYDSCQDWYKFVADNGIETLFAAPTRAEAEVLIPVIVENGVKGKKAIIDVGCGTGIKTIYYALINPNAKIIGIDFSAPLIRAARKRAKKYALNNLIFMTADLTNIEHHRKLKTRKFDSVICTNMISEGGIAYGAGGGIHYNDMLSAKAKSLADLTSANGILVLSCNPNRLIDYKDHLYSHLELAGFKDLSYKFIKHIRPYNPPEECTNLTIFAKK